MLCPAVACYTAILRPRARVRSTKNPRQKIPVVCPAMGTKWQRFAQQGAIPRATWRERVTTFRISFVPCSRPFHGLISGQRHGQCTSSVRPLARQACMLRLALSNPAGPKTGEAATTQPATTKHNHTQKYADSSRSVSSFADLLLHYRVTDTRHKPTVSKQYPYR